MSGKVVLAGGTGFIGAHLRPALESAGYEVVLLGRKPGTVLWDAQSFGPWTEELKDAVALINLTGEPINQRWTPEAKQRILSSRVDATKILGRAMVAFGGPNLRWINASAVGFYGDRGTERLTEASPAGTGFLADTCRAWEDAVGASPSCRFRIGFVLGRDGGAYPMLAKLARLGAGGTVGSGQQGISWIHIEDLVQALVWLVQRPTLPSVVNATAPQPVSNEEFMRGLRKSVGQPIGLPTPAFALRIAAAALNTSPDLVLQGSYVLPQVLQDGGFSFRFPTLGDALRNLAKA